VGRRCPKRTWTVETDASCSSSTTTWTSSRTHRARCPSMPPLRVAHRPTAPNSPLPPARLLRPCQRSLRRTSTSTSTSRSRSTPSWANTPRQSRSKSSSPPPRPHTHRSPSVERVQKRASSVLKLTQENEKLKEELKAMTARIEAAERRRQEIATRQLQQTQQQPSSFAQPARSQGSS
jgi:hypothetical protein